MNFDFNIVTLTILAVAEIWFLKRPPYLR